MRIRTAQFAMIPMWVIQHKEVRGNGTRMAVYAGLQAAAFETPEKEWRSTRQMATAVAELTGLGEEGCRKHLSALVLIGAIVKTETEVLMPADPPGLGIPVGSTEPTAVPLVPSQPDDTSTSLRKKDKTNAVGTHGSSPDGDGVCFEDFWKLYPRHTSPTEARKCWNRQVKGTDTVKATKPEVIIAGLQARVAWYKRARTPMDKIPHASTWLNQQRWLDELEPTPVAAAASIAQANADLAVRQRDEVDQAIAAGDADLAWKLTRARAKARRDFWFDDIARGIDEGRSDSALLVGHERDGRRMTAADVAEVKAIKAQLWQACGLSPAVAELANPHVGAS